MIIFAVFHWLVKDLQAAYVLNTLNTNNFNYSDVWNIRRCVQWFLIRRHSRVTVFIILKAHDVRWYDVILASYAWMDTFPGRSTLPFHIFVLSDAELIPFWGVLLPRKANRKSHKKLSPFVKMAENMELYQSLIYCIVPQ